MSRSSRGSLPWARADPAARLNTRAMLKRRMAPSLLSGTLRSATSIDEILADQPFLDDLRDLGIVLVLHQHVRVTLDADLRQVDHVDAATASAYGGGVFEIDPLERRPA